MEVRIRRLEATRVVTRHHEGPYEGLAGAIDALVRWLRAHKETGSAVTTVFLDPAHLEAGLPEPDEHRPEPADPPHAQGPTIRAEVWVETNDRTAQAATDEAELTTKPVEATDAACVTLTGDPLQIPHLALALRGFLQEQGYRISDQTRVVHLMPDWEQPTNWVAEVQVPIEGKNP